MLRIGNRVRHANGGIGTITNHVLWEDAKKPGVFHREKDAVEVTWEITGITTSEWKADLTKMEAN